MTTLYIVLLLIINAFFVAAEFALVKVSGIRIDSLAAEGNYLAKQTAKIRVDLEAYLAACQLGITMASLGLGWIGEPAVAALLEPAFAGMGISTESIHFISFLTGFVLFSSLHIVIGEQVPKTYAIRSAEKVAMVCAIPLIMFYWFAFPLNWSLNRASGLILRMMGVKEVSHVEVMTGSEISGLIDVSRDHGAIESDQADMLQNLFRFDERVVHGVMLPRRDIDVLQYKASKEETLAAIAASNHSRLPVIDENWDQLKGVVITRDVLNGFVKNGDIVMDDYLRPAQLIPESVTIRILFNQMKNSRQHMALVVDEFGQIDGLITLEDLLEEMVGDIKDESDDDEIDHYIKKTDTGWLVHALTPLHDLELQIGFRTEIATTASTLSGFLVQRLQAIPAIEDTWLESGFRFTVTRAGQAHVEEVHIERLSGRAEPDPHNPDEKN